MTPRSDLRYDSQRLDKLERQQAAFARALRAPRRSRSSDPDDVQGFGQADGFARVFDRDTGLWKPVIPPPMITFNMPGALALEESDVFFVPADCKVFLWSVGLKTTGSSTTTIALKKHPSTSIETLSLGSGDSYENESLGYALAAGDGVFVEATALGTGAEGAVVSVWAKAT